MTKVIVLLQFERYSADNWPEFMKNITETIQLLIGDPMTDNGDKQIKQLFTGPRRKLIEIRLKNGAIVPRHRAKEPITVLCLSGSGIFRAGEMLDEEQRLTPGTLVTLESEIDHEVTADPEVQILVTKFTDD